MPEVREGIVAGGLPYLAVGDGSPLVVFPGLGPSNANPTGLQRRGEISFLASLASGFAVYEVNRRPGLEPTTTMADLAADYARALADEFSGPVDALGISTGGSLALQLAVDHPRLLRRLVVACSAYRLGPTGREIQRRIAEFAARGYHRRAFQQLAPAFATSRLGQRLAGGLLWLVEPLACGREWNPSDMVITIKAEDTFDLRDRLGEVGAPTLVIGGDRDPAYARELFRDTAERIPDARLVIYEGRGHVGTILDRRFAGDVVAFLKAEYPAP